MLCRASPLTGGVNKCLFDGELPPSTLFAVAPYFLRGLEKELFKPDISGCFYYSCLIIGNGVKQSIFKYQLNPYYLLKSLTYPCQVVLITNKVMINNPTNIVYHIFRINSEPYSEPIQKTTQPLTISIRGVVVQVMAAKNVKQELAKPKLIASYQLMDFFK